MLHFALRRSQNIHWQALDVDKAARAALKGQRPCVLWFTGLSGAGQVDDRQPGREASCTRCGRHTYLLDGDNVRHGLNKDLGFTDADRVENIRRVGRGRQADGRRRPDRAGLVHLAVPRRARDGARAARARASSSRSSSTRRWRSPRSATPRASTRRRGAASSTNFTGIDSPYEAPESAELRIDTTALSAEQAADAVDRRCSSAPASCSSALRPRRSARGASSMMPPMATRERIHPDTSLGPVELIVGDLDGHVDVLRAGHRPHAARALGRRGDASAAPTGGTADRARRRPRRAAAPSPLDRTLPRRRSSFRRARSSRAPCAA